VVRPKPAPHAATLPTASTLQPRPAKKQLPSHSATARQARAPHPAAVAQPRVAPAALEAIKVVARHRAPLSERDLIDAVATYQRETEALIKSPHSAQAILQASGLRRAASDVGPVRRPPRAIQAARASNRGLMGERESGAIGEFWNFASQVSSFMVNAPVPTVAFAGIAANLALLGESGIQIAEALREGDDQQATAGWLNFAAALLGLLASGTTLLTALTEDFSPIVPAFLGFVSAGSWLYGEWISSVSVESNSTLFRALGALKGFGAVLSTLIGLAGAAAGGPLGWSVATALTAGIPAIGSLGAAAIHYFDSSESAEAEPLRGGRRLSPYGTF
jgi:hypothetical protein